MSSVRPRHYTNLSLAAQKSQYILVCSPALRVPRVLHTNCLRSFAGLRTISRSHTVQRVPASFLTLTTIACPIFAEPSFGSIRSFRYQRLKLPYAPPRTVGAHGIHCHP